jgi:hypothetical protein
MLMRGGDYSTPDCEVDVASKNRVHDAAFHPQGRAVCRRREWTGHEGNHRRDFVQCGKALQERTGSYSAEKLPFHFSGRSALGFCHISYESFDAFEGVGPASTEFTVTTEG